MEGTSADSDHSMTWEDFFGSTTDLTPTLIGIYDSLLEPKNLRPEVSRFNSTAKDARNDPPLHPILPDQQTQTRAKFEDIANVQVNPPKDPSKIAGSIKLPGLGNLNRNALYSIRTNVESANGSEVNGAMNHKVENIKCSVVNSDSSVINKNTVYKSQLRSFKTDKPIADAMSSTNTFHNLSPNVKRMISSATETNKTNTVKFQKRTGNAFRTSNRGHKSNIPLVGATSKISQSGVEILPSVEIYDQPSTVKTSSKQNSEEENIISSESPSKFTPVRAEFRLETDALATYDVPTNKQAIYDVPSSNSKTAFESLSLPYIDQSIELSITSNDREFDIKLSSKENPPIKQQMKTSPESTPIKYPNSIANGGTNSLHRKDFVNKTESPSKQLLKQPYPDSIGSTGNLKLCSVPERDSGRLHPPTVEVSRPLSMSSITSSSSTSSSGVQNKGGVNSAYLASIESLDDHSDADVNSAVGSNNFVNNAGMIASIAEDRHSEAIPRFHTEELSGLSQLERVCAEIVQTENVYVEDLRQVVEGYLHVWKKESVFSEEELAELFNNIENIYIFNRSLCEELNICHLDATSIARCFVDNTTGFAVYTSYCTGYPRTMERLALLASRPHSARAFRERQVALGHPLPLASYLLKPVQRILKYHLLLQNVVKLCASRDTEFALLKMTGIAQHIDDMKRKHEHAVRVQEIQSLLYGWSGPDLTTYGELCAEGTFRVFGAKAMRHVFLFDKMLLITKNREDGILAYKSHIMCNNMMLVESISGAPLSFHVIPWDSPRAQLTLQATSPRHKREWTLLLKRVILENYHAVIPSHARQLVMELGQNKTDDDILAEKSHNLITQASMRKQLSAPEYLEKRKLERERRKSFENGPRGRLKKANRKHTVPNIRSDPPLNICDCSQVSAEKGIDYTCDNCYIDLCSDCDIELSNKDKIREEKCSCKNDDNELSPEKCPECDRSLHFIDAGSAEHLERKQSCCKCSDFKSSQESVGKEFTSSLNKTRGYHSSDNIVGYSDNSKSKEDLSETNTSCSNVRSIHKTCLKCAKIKENIAVTESTSAIHSRKSRCNEIDKYKADTFRSKSKEDPQRSKLSRIGTWRRKSEPGLQQNVVGIVPKKTVENNESDRNAANKGGEKIEFECRICGSNKITKNIKNVDGVFISDPEVDTVRRATGSGTKQNVEIKMYNSKNIPKKITKLKKSRAKGVRLGSDTTARFYADLSSDVSTENILHISESNDSLNVVDKKGDKKNIPETISKDEDIDEETYKKLIEKTDSFKKNELEKVKYLNNQKVINEGSEMESDKCEVQTRHENNDVAESCEDAEQPLEQIISQLLMQNREFQKLLKKQQQRNTAQRRHQRLLKSHSNPEEVLASRANELNKIKPKYGRQTSENFDINTGDVKEKTILSPPNELDDYSEDDHIYETLRVDAKPNGNANKNLHDSDSYKTQSKGSPLAPHKFEQSHSSNKPKGDVLESDYVYLSFDQLNNLNDIENDGIYDVPVKLNDRIDNVSKPVDYYVTVENIGPKPDYKDMTVENMYDNIIEVCRREKGPTSTAPGEYLPMSPDLNPNAPEIWLSRQKEHFNMSRDRKSGSLPRSFQVVTTNQEENNLSTFRCKPSNNSKTYLNRDGKVLSIDRPFTIASDKSEISYDDVENYMSDGDILKFTKSNSNPKANEQEAQNISKSTLELEEEIDRCYKNNFEKIGLDPNKNENLLTVSQPNLNISATSSCEALLLDKNAENNPPEVEVIHPEHKIYKPTSNLISLKNVLSRFKTKNPNKNFDSTEVNANDLSSPDSAKSDVKSPTSNEKRPALNPRSYSRNLLQRFRSIIGDEQPEDSLNKSELSQKSKNLENEAPNNLKNEIKVVITSTDVSPVTSTIVYTINSDPLSRSVCENTTQSQNEKVNLENLSHSCDNIVDDKQDQMFRPPYEKSISMITNISSSIASTSSPTKSNNSSYQSLNKLPIYMQGSKNLGARIAQSDYVDPTTLINDSKFGFNNVNVLINKNAVRPDSLFSNSSFVTSSSEGAYQTDGKAQNDNNNTQNNEKSAKQKSSDSSAATNSDESYYERSFEKIEHVTDEDVFRDSAVYSDQEDVDETKTDSVKDRKLTRQVTKVESIKSNTQSRVIVSTSRIEQVHVNKERRSLINIARPKVAPPVPAKPKLVTNIPTTSSDKPHLQTKSYRYGRSNSLVKNKEETSSFESVNVKTIKRNSNFKQSLLRSESTPTERKKADISSENDNDGKPNENIINATDSVHEATIESSVNTLSTNNIQIKRLSFERASLDSATRKIKTTSTDSKRFSTEIPKITSKTVLERRLEIESMSKTLTSKPSVSKKPSQITKPKSISTKMANFERSLGESSKKEIKQSIGIDLSNIPNEANKPEIKEENESKESWVKQVVNKFQ